MTPKKVGRPKIKNPKNTQVTARLVQEDVKKLNENAQHYQEDIAESIRRSIRELNKAIKK